MIQDARDSLACGILDQLKSKSMLPTIIPFCHDAFCYFFGGKGETSNEKGAVLLERPDFDNCKFPEDWDIIVDSIGDGLKIDFPVKLRPFLLWSPKTHMLKDGKVVVCPRYRPEKLSISICKTAFSL